MESVEVLNSEAQREELIGRLLNVLPIDLNDETQVAQVRSSVLDASIQDLEEISDNVLAAEEALRVGEDDDVYGYGATHNPFQTLDTVLDAAPEETADLSEVVGFSGFDN